MSTTFGRALRVLFVSMVYVVIYGIMQNVIAYGIGFLGMYRALPASGRELIRAFDETFVSGIFLCTILSMAVSFVLYAAFGLLRERPLGHELQFRKLNESSFIPAILLALGCRLAVSVYTVLADHIPSLVKSLENSRDYSNSMLTPGGFIIFLLSSVVFGPIFEEILFRGFVQTELLRGFPPSAAIVIGALIFGAAHGMLFQSVFTFFVGLVLGWCYYITKNLFVSIIVHIIFNATSIVTLAITFGDIRILIAASAAAFIMIVPSCVWLYFKARRI